MSELATRQYGVVARSQLLDLGASRMRISRWLDRSFLRVVHAGVYAVGHAHLSFRGACTAAVLAAGPTARISGAAAGWLRGVVRREPQVIDVISTSRRHQSPDGVRIRWARSLPDDECGWIDGIPVTSVARMLVDLAADMVVTELADVMHELDFRDLLDVRALRASIRRSRTRRGPTCRRISNALVLNRSGSAGTQSHLERRTLDDLLERGAPMPRITPRLTIRGRHIRPDLLFEACGIAVEIDGKPHERRRTQVDDADKTELLESVGLRVLRIDHRTRRRDTDTVLRAIGIHR